METIKKDLYKDKKCLGGGKIMAIPKEDKNWRFIYNLAQIKDI